MRNTRIARQIRLLMLLQSRRRLTAKDLAKELAVCRRTVHRDLNVLELAGVPFLYEPDVGYRILHDFFLPPIHLTVDEALAMSVLSSQVEGLGQAPLLKSAWMAMTKIRGQLSTAVRDELETADDSTVIRTAAASVDSRTVGHLQTINVAITKRRKLRLVYEPARADSEDGKPFVLCPYKLYFGQRAWYVIGLSERRSEERTLKLARIRKLELTERTYEIPDGWSVEKIFGKAWRMMKGEKTYQVEIEFTGEHARTMADTLWHSTQKVTWRTDNSCVFQCEVAGLDEIVWWILGYGPHARVMKPVELQNRIAKLAGDVISLYDTTSESDSRSKSEAKRPTQRRRRMLA